MSLKAGDINQNYRLVMYPVPVKYNRVGYGIKTTTNLPKSKHYLLGKAKSLLDYAGLC